MSADLKFRANALVADMWELRADNDENSLVELCELFPAVELIEDLVVRLKELEMREKKVVKALKEIAISEECHELWYQAIAKETLKELEIIQ